MMGSEDNDGATYVPFLNQPTQTAHHSLTHANQTDAQDPSGNNVTDQTLSVKGQIEMIQNYYAQQFFKLISMLDAVPEGAGTMLDNTLVVWSSELCDASRHAFNGSLPVVLAGGAGVIPMNRVLDLRAAKSPPRLNRLLVSILNTMGVPATQQGVFDTDSTGKWALTAGYALPWTPGGSGPLPGL